MKKLTLLTPIELFEEVEEETVFVHLHLHSPNCKLRPQFLKYEILKYHNFQQYMNLINSTLITFFVSDIQILTVDDILELLWT